MPEHSSCALACACRSLVALLLALICSSVAVAGPLREYFAERRAQAQGQVEAAGDEVPAGRPLPGVRVLRDIAYGDHLRQRFDVYLPQTPVRGAPVLLMVHGGGWAHGDKAMPSVVENKARRWVPRGVIFVSINYRLLPDAHPLDQTRDLARALAVAQQKAAEWGGDRGRFVLMGHSAGGHLVSLLAASPTLVRDAGAAPWLGTVALDSAAFDVVRQMGGRHMHLYDTAFGKDPAYWRAASPLHQLQGPAAPLLAVCSSIRRDRPCDQAQAFAARGRQVGMPVEVLPQPLSHRDINQSLGADNGYSQAVDAFLQGLDAGFGRR